jgi:hypothetical protein
MSACELSELFSLDICDYVVMDFLAAKDVEKFSAKEVRRSAVSLFLFFCLEVC